VPTSVDTGIDTITRPNVAQFWRELRDLKR
jgi:hypothetical protein